MDNVLSVSQDSGVFFRKLQQEELNGAKVYQKIAAMTKDEKERETLLSISREEYRHAEIFAKYSGYTLKPSPFLVAFYSAAARLLGYTFVIKLMERREDSGIAIYRNEINRIPEMRDILEQEEIHEQKLLDILDEERLHYIGPMVLGMNDALVELTGALAGYTLAMRNTHIIAMAGLITGVAATLSMAASGYLAARESGVNNAAKSSAYTGTAYLITVILLILPYLLFPVNGYMWALAFTLLMAFAIIACFNLYISITKGRPFLHGFLVMAGISLGVAVISFFVGLLVKNALGIEL